MPILEPPIDLNKFPVTLGFWVDSTTEPSLVGFYTLFDDHHPGVDFDLPKGTPIATATPGIVVRREFHKGMGNTLAIRLGNIYVLYAHLSEFCVELGQIIRPKQLIAYSGNTGTATTSAHLHFELRDLTTKGLKESVFEPVFGKPLERYTPTFNYIVNTSNTEKTLVGLALRYFGLPTFASFLRDNNPDLKDHPFDTPLPHGQQILIPSPK